MACSWMFGCRALDIVKLKLQGAIVTCHTFIHSFADNHNLVCKILRMVRGNDTLPALYTCKCRCSSQNSVCWLPAGRNQTGLAGSHYNFDFHFLYIRRARWSLANNTGNCQKNANTLGLQVNNQKKIQTKALSLLIKTPMM